MDTENVKCYVPYFLDSSPTLELFLPGYQAPAERNKLHSRIVPTPCTYAHTQLC